MGKRVQGRVSQVRSKIMSQIRCKNTKCEIALRKELSRRGLRYRLHKKDLPGKPDIVFVAKKVAIFCDGDFWHGRKWNQEKPKFRVRSTYWVRKIEGNVARDKRINAQLRRMGWKVLRFWETEINKAPSTIADRIAKCLRKRKSGSL